MAKRNKNRIRSFLVARGITNSSIATAIGVSNALVCSTIAGYRNNRKVLMALMERNVPPRYLALPDDMLAPASTATT